MGRSSGYDNASSLAPVGRVEPFKRGEVDDFAPVASVYRPYCKQWLYFNRMFNNTVYLMPKLFPTDEQSNRVIAISGVGAGAGYSVLMTDEIPCQTMAGAGNTVQCFPLYYYDGPDQEGKQDTPMFDLLEGGDRYERRDAITDRALLDYQDRYGNLSKEDIFYYVYGILHSPEYTARLGFDLNKTIPRIPMARDFWAFSKAGRDLSDLHITYETVDPWPATSIEPFELTPEQLRVTKMKFGPSRDKSMIVYNSEITLRDIPLEAYEYEVNGRSAIEWTWTATR